MQRSDRDRLDLDSERIASLLAAKRNVWRTLDLAAVLQGAIEAAVDVTGFDTGAIYLLDANRLYLGATTPPLPSDFPDELRISSALDHPHIMRAIDTEQAYLVSDLRAEPLTDQEAAVVQARDLRTILYAPLLTADRPVGVFMVGSVGATVEVSDRVIAAATVLAHSVALAIDNARLFDALSHDARALGDRDLTERLQELARTSAAEDPSRCAEASRLAHEIAARLRQRIALLALSDEVQAAQRQRIRHSGPDLARADVAWPGPAPLDDALAGLLRLGMVPALQELAEAAGVGPDPASIEADPAAQMTDVDTALVLLAAARDLLDHVASVPGGQVERIRVSADHADTITLAVTDNGVALAPCQASEAVLRSLVLERLKRRLDRFGAELVLVSEPGGRCTAMVRYPHFSLS